MRSDLISRAELFNKLSVIQAPAEAGEYKARVYEIIQNLPLYKQDDIPDKENDDG